MQGFFQFNNTIINEISNFATSACDVLLIRGPKGSGKSETIRKVLPELAKTNLIFQHFCFENSVIDDFLLNFYDSFKSFTNLNKISLKKYSAENFEDRIKHYFKIINQDCIIIVENFENIAENNEIIDFLAYLTNFKNIRIIAISRKDAPNPFKTRKVITQELEIEQISKKDFKSKFAILAETTDDEMKEKFYNFTGGLELYLNMVVKYCTITGCSIKDLINEYERKKVAIYSNFEEFIVSKFYSLTPSTYLKLLKALCTISHPVSKRFIEEYKFGTSSYVNYLLKNFLISSFDDMVYVKDYFKQYILKLFSIQEKVSYYKNLANIYENELQKSPKDRLIRLSRESIRKEAQRANSLVPSINPNEESKNAFKYIGNNSWHDENLRQKSKLTEKLNKIKERKNFLSKNKQNTFIPHKPTDENLRNVGLKEEDRRFIISLINSSREYAANYDYDSAISELKRAQETDTEFEFAIEILSLIGKYHESLNEFDSAQKSYNEALNYALENNDSRKTEIKFRIAVCNKNLYKNELSKKMFYEIASNENNSDNYRSKALIEAGEIEQASANNEDAIKCYGTALSISLGKNKELVCKAYYRLAVLYDEMGDYEEALKYYKKNTVTSSEYSDNKYYSASLTNSALILYEQNELKDALVNLKLALQFDSERNDFENMYFAQKELARIYSNIDEISAIGYYKQALTSAQSLKDDFKTANIYFEAGEFYYDRGNDEKALINFFNAKYALKDRDDSENVSKIISRINDLKVRLDDNTYNSIAEKYDK